MIPVDRHHSLDAVRAGALLLGIVLHGTVSFWPGMREGNYPVSDDQSSAFLSGLYFVLHVFRMSLFFAIAGFFAHAVFLRLGTWGFVKNRLRRIGLPLVVSLLVCLPLIGLAYFWAQRQLGLTGVPDLSPPIPNPQLPPWGHLWFLYLLLVLYALWLGGRVVVRAVDRRGSIPDFIAGALDALMTRRLAALALAAPAALSMYAAPWWIPWQGIPQPIWGFVPNVPALLAFGAAFGFGWFLHRRPAWLEVLRRDWALYLAMAVVLTGVSMALVGAKPQLHVPAMPVPERAMFAAAYNIAGWCWIFGLIGAALRFLDQPDARWRYLADSSFFVYILHLPVSYLLATLMLRWPLHWSLKFGLIVALTTGTTLILYHYLVRDTFVGVFLNGRRYPRPAILRRSPSISPG